MQPDDISNNWNVFYKALFLCFRPRLKRSLFPVQWVAKIVTSSAAAKILFFVCVSFG